MGALFWKVDIGYGPLGESPTSLNDITFTDYNRPFSITYGNTVISKGSIKYNDFQEYLISQIGEDISTLYSYPISQIPTNYYGYQNELIPSTLTSAPNLWEIQKTGSDINVYILFKDSGRLTTANRGGTIWQVEGNLLTVIYNGVDRNIRFYSSFKSNYIDTFFLNLDAYTSEDSLINGAYDLITLNIFGPNTSNNKVISTALTGSWVKEWATALFLNNAPSSDGPYAPIDPSGPGGGGGSFDDSSDMIPDSPLPSLSSANTGFTRIYNPTLAQVQQLAQYLWTDETLIETLWNKVKQYFEDPMQAIIGFNLVPVPVPDAGTKSFALMYIDTGVDMNVAASQFVDRDCGTLTIEPYYGSALDYAPHTKISIFLPFIGTVQLSTDEVMGRTLQVKYRVDICSGSCVAKVAVDGNYIYQFSGHCAIPIPISSSDFSSYVGAAISVAKLGITAAVGAATGGAGLFVAGAAQETGNVVSTMRETTTERNPMTGRQITTATRTVETSTPASSTGASFNGLSAANVANTVGDIMASKPAIEHSGSFSGNTGYLGVRRPFLIIERPNLCLPSDFQKLNGYPSMITMPLSDCTGYTVVQQVQLTGLGATNPEQAEILELLKGGVIF